jgi:hypothetical protein
MEQPDIRARYIPEEEYEQLVKNYLKHFKGNTESVSFNLYDLAAIMRQPGADAITIVFGADKKGKLTVMLKSTSQGRDTIQYKSDDSLGAWGK